MGIEKLTAENAIIKTASVEVKTLTISGKQVTLAVFRQLPQRPLIQWQAYKPVGLRGLLWGRVNYHPDRCDRDPDPHWHVVWQDNATLYRDRIDEDYLVTLAKREPEAFQVVREASTSTYSNLHNSGIVVGLKTRWDGRDWNQSEADEDEYHELIYDIEQSDQLYIAV